MMTKELQIKQLRKAVEFLVVHKLATNVILGTAIIGKNIEVIRSKSNLITPRDSSPVAIIGKTESDHIINYQWKM